MDFYLSFLFIIRIPVERLKKSTNGHERGATFELERNKALGRIVENGHIHAL